MPFKKGLIPWNKGGTHSPETRAKLSRSLKGKRWSPEAKARMSAQRKGSKHWNWGNKYSEETKSRMRENALRQFAEKGHPSAGKKMAEETKKKIGDANRGRIKSTETIAKMSLASTGRVFSEESRRKKSAAMKGDKCYNWKGGKTTENHRIRDSLEYRIWRTSVFKRDNFTCVWCGARSKKGFPVVLNADHIKPFAFFPELRLVLENGRTLCRPCHLTTLNGQGLPKQA